MLPLGSKGKPTLLSVVVTGSKAYLVAQNRPSEIDLVECGKTKTNGMVRTGGGGTVYPEEDRSTPNLNYKFLGGHTGREVTKNSGR